MRKKTAPGNHSCMSDIAMVDRLTRIDPGYGILFTIGVGTGAELYQLLELKVSDLAGVDHISMPVGPLQILRTFNLPEDLKEALVLYIDDRTGPLFVLQDGSPITATDAARAFRQCGVYGSFLLLLLKRYYNQTGDIYYPLHMLNLFPV